MAATREQLERVMDRLEDGKGACKESYDWVSLTAGTPAQLWKLCLNGGWLEDLVIGLAHMGGGCPRANEWDDYIFTGSSSASPSADEIRRLVPWRMVDAAIQREGNR